jgi:hypothetical protein
MAPVLSNCHQMLVILAAINVCEGHGEPADPQALAVALRLGHEAVEPSKSEGEKRWRDATNMARLRDSGLLDLAGKKR